MPQQNLRFTKKPVTIEAFQMTEARRLDNSEWPEWLNAAWNKDEGQEGAVFRQNMDAPLPDLLCRWTLEGVHLVNWGDWIIRGVKGELYPCKPDIFEATYTPESAALSSQGAVGAAQPARVVDGRDAALNLIMKMCNDSKEPCSTDPESAGAIRNGKFASIAGVAAQGLGLIRGPSLSTPPAAPTPSQAGVVTELEDVKRWFMNPETGMLVQTERGPWVRYVDVLAAFEAKKAGQA